jgi:maleylpyruvate isomerase
MSLLLHGYWRSGTSYRTRIALLYKGLEFHQSTHDLRKGEQQFSQFLALNPQGLVPVLEVDGWVLTQSPAILEWLDENYPDPPLLPRGARERALVRAMAALIACDIHPLNNLRILTALRSEFAASDEAVKAWIKRWIADGFAALEPMIKENGAGFAFGDSPTLADCYLVPQVYSAERFGVDLTPFVCVQAAAERARALPAFVAAHPDKQPDAG